MEPSMAFTVPTARPHALRPSKRPSPSLVTAAETTPTRKLRDSDENVVIGIHKASSPTAKQAKKDTTLPTKATEADVVMLVPDEFAPEIYEASVKDNLKPGAMLMFAHGFNIHFGFIKPREDVDVAMIAPKGHTVRFPQFELGGGVPQLVAIHQDTGKAKDRLSYGAGLGSARSNIIETTFKEETEPTSGEQVVPAAAF